MQQKRDASCCCSSSACREDGDGFVILARLPLSAHCSQAKCQFDRRGNTRFKPHTAPRAAQCLIQVLGHFDDASPSQSEFYSLSLLLFSGLFRQFVELCHEPTELSRLRDQVEVQHSSSDPFLCFLHLDHHLLSEEHETATHPHKAQP